MNYIVPQTDQINTSFLFTVCEHVYPDGHVVPTQLLLSKNLNEIYTMPLDTLRMMAKRLNIAGRSHMNKNTLSNIIQQMIVFE
jgi:hypothetical protein